MDSNGAAYLTGTIGGDFPVTANAFQQIMSSGTCTPAPGFFGYPIAGDAYVAKVSPDGTSLEYRSYLGGGCAESG